MREALLMLELQGTVDIRQGSGVYVMRIPHENDSEEEQLLSSDVGRLKFSGAPAAGEQHRRLCREMATRADIDNLKRIIEQEQRAIALNDTAQDNARLFHLVLAGATQNQMLLATVERIWLQMDSSPLWQQFNVHIASRAAAEMARRPADPARRAAASRCDGRGRRCGSIWKTSKQPAGAVR